MGHASKGMLVPRSAHASDRKLSPAREPSVSHVATGPIVLRREPNPHHPKRASYRLEDEAMLRIRCRRGGSVQTTEVQACALTIVPLHPNMAAGGWRR